MLKEQIKQDVKAALVAKDKVKAATLRLIMAAIKQKEVDQRIEMDDTAILGVLESMVKQRKESIEQYQKADRQDLVDQEQQELEILKVYMPEPLSEAELDTIIQCAIAETGASSMQDMGKVMGKVKAAAQGRADMGTISQKVKSLLAS